MDEIQRVLIKQGRKDLAQRYYLKVAGSYEDTMKEELKKIDDEKLSKWKRKAKIKLIRTPIKFGPRKGKGFHFKLKISGVGSDVGGLSLWIESQKPFKGKDIDQLNPTGTADKDVAKMLEFLIDSGFNITFKNKRLPSKVDRALGIS